MPLTHAADNRPLRKQPHAHAESFTYFTNNQTLVVIS
jgi:hypothetical protein